MRLRPGLARAGAVVLVLALMASLPPIARQAEAAGLGEAAAPLGSIDGSTGDGYWMLGRSGEVYAFGNAVDYGDAQGRTTRAAALVASPGGFGYWILTAAGSVWEYGSVVDLPSVVSPADFVAGAATPTGGGMWAFAENGAVKALGDAVHYGDMAGIALNGPIIDAAITPDGGGYWLLGSDGGIFAFGNAEFHGSIQGLVNRIVRPGFPASQWLAEPIVGIVPSPENNGYWLVAADGGVFAFPGSLPFRGSVPGVLGPGGKLAKPINGMVAYGDGYLMSASDGGVFTFSNLSFLGSLGANPPAQPIVGLTPLPGLPTATVSQALVSGDVSSPLLAQVEFAPNVAGMTSMEVFGTRSGQTLTPELYVIAGQGPTYPLSININSGGELSRLEYGDGTVLVVLDQSDSEMRVERTDPSGLVNYHTVEIGAIPAASQASLLGSGLTVSAITAAGVGQQAFQLPAQLREWTVYGAEPARIGINLVTPAGVPINATLSSASASCSTGGLDFECRITQGNGELLLHTGVRVTQRDGVRFDTNAECSQFEWRVGAIGGGLIPFALGLAALGPVTAVGAGWLFVFGSTSTALALIETSRTDCAVVSADSVRDNVMAALATEGLTARTTAFLSFTGVTLEHNEQSIDWRMDLSALNGGARIGELTYVGQVDRTLEILSPTAGSNFQATTGVPLSVTVRVTGGAAGEEVVASDFSYVTTQGPTSVSGLVSTVTDNSRVRTYQFEGTYATPGNYTLRIDVLNGIDAANVTNASSARRFRESRDYTVTVVDPRPTSPNCEVITQLGVGEVCASASLTGTTGDWTLVYVESELLFTECFNLTKGTKSMWTAEHQGDFRWTRDVAALRASVIKEQWRPRVTLTCPLKAFQQATWDVTPVVTNISVRYANAILAAIGEQLATRGPTCFVSPSIWPRCQLGRHGDTGPMDKAEVGG